jgi:hypothetical protein
MIPRSGNQIAVLSVLSTFLVHDSGISYSS